MLYVALWFDARDKTFRVAGVYSAEKKAWNRVTRLGYGTVKRLRLNEAVHFCGENSFQPMECREDSHE